MAKQDHGLKDQISHVWQQDVDIDCAKFPKLLSSYNRDTVVYPSGIAQMPSETNAVLEFTRNPPPLVRGWDNFVARTSTR